MATTVEPQLSSIPDKPSLHWMDRLDRWSFRVSDKLNPILVKETRQALKSRQFMVTFSVLLFSALSWTVVGSLSMMPQIYTTPSAPRMLIGYYLVLALPMLLVVPLAAFRSLESEIDDGTLELLSITTLTPRQVVLGKLASAMLQMLLYYVALFPCVAYAYTLRGVDLPTTILMMCTLLVAGVLLTIVALFFAAVTRSRTGRIITLLATVMLLLGAESGLAALMVEMIFNGNSLGTAEMLFVITATLMISIALGHLLLTATAAQLTPESENRSTNLRLSLMFLTAVLMGLGTLAVGMLPSESVALVMFFLFILAVLWALCGSMLAAESPTMTPRILRELPSSFFARCALTWLTPGPTTGLAFATVNIAIVAISVAIGIEYLIETSSAWRTYHSILQKLILAYAAYLVGMLVMVRFMISLIRIRNHVRVEIGIAALVVVAVVTALVPYSLGLHFNDYRPYSYSYWQVTNWAWTLLEISLGRDLSGVVTWLALFSAIFFLTTMLASPHLVMPRRIATPRRVRQELEAQKKTNW